MTAGVVLAVILGGVVGALARFGLSQRFPAKAGRLAPGILVANVVGSAIGGAVLGLAERAALSDEWSLIILTGFCGGLTTFSTWSVDTVELALGKHWRAALANLVVTLALAVGTAAVAYLLTR
ncbi:fluoride efflux transporter CrcB [Agromyces atrinae]|uniref:fluoride efflux transporter CrcB n=1 Tax=Agromyces atrinae TaxID=592376 RepID=UPI001F5894FE|nr:fluoride efflux transporter CrcB [Agromyces atrinae]MCI2956377.1 fluoride efflux transporter CrcB [Agromyces atrinae]